MLGPLSDCQSLAPGLVIVVAYCHTPWPVAPLIAIPRVLAACSRSVREMPVVASNELT